MKLEEAIAKAKILNDSLKELTDEYEGQGSFIAAGMAVTFKLVLDTILSALRPVSREQVEKVWRGEWVKRHKHRGGFRRVKGIDDMGEQHEVTIDERCEYDDLYCPKCGRQSPDNFLNFCGYCGEAFTTAAVDMVMERWEALNDGKGD